MLHPLQKRHQQLNVKHSVTYDVERARGLVRLPILKKVALLRAAYSSKVVSIDAFRRGLALPPQFDLRWYIGR